MRPIFSAKIVTVILVVAALGGGAYFYISRRAPQKVPVAGPTIVPGPTEVTFLGKSVEGRDITAYTYGEGATHLAFVGGVHGGYEWNSVLIAYQFMDYLATHPDIVPKKLSVTVIPDLNPDGVYKVIGKEGRFTINDAPKGDLSAGRFNAHNVDLNRNFDCNWQPKGIWKGKVVSAGTAAFSEPEARALRDFVAAQKPSAVIFWHSQANAVYASECNGGILPQTLDIMNIYARAAGYPAVKSFDAYEVHGDSEGWLASLGIPALTVELSTHESIEWDRNFAGIEAILKYYSQLK